jgi:hypothetical protein
MSLLISVKCIVSMCVRSCVGHQNVQHTSGMFVSPPSGTRTHHLINAVMASLTLSHQESHDLSHKLIKILFNHRLCTGSVFVCMRLRVSMRVFRRKPYALAFVSMTQ